MTKRRNKKLLFDGAEWTVDLMDKAWETIDKYGKEWLELDYPEPQFRITTSDQMISACATHGIPTFYSHWSMGKSFLELKKQYEKGTTGLAYEMIINSDPAVAYMMENNTMTMMALTMSHAAVGHGSVYRMNHLFKEQASQAKFVLDYTQFAQDYITWCEDQYGEQEVEWLLDRAHALQWHSVDRYKRPNLSRESRKQKAQKSYEYYRDEYSKMLPSEKLIPDYASIAKGHVDMKRWVANGLEESHETNSRSLPEENMLYFLEKCSPILRPWQREILRIVRTLAQYFYPQMKTKLVHEGWASFVHHEIMTKLWEDGHLTDGSYFEFLQDHTAVCRQPDQTAAMNPYKLGYAMFKDLKRICLDPDDEDREWFPELAGVGDWRKPLTEIMSDSDDRSFLLGYLGPKVIRELKLALIENDNEAYYKIAEVHDNEGVWALREALADDHGISIARLPTLEVVYYTPQKHGVIINVIAHNKMPLQSEELAATTQYIQDLWGQSPKLNFTLNYSEEL